LDTTSSDITTSTSSLTLLIADSGVTDHMFPDQSVFVLHKSITHLQVRMGNNSLAPVLGVGTAVFSLNGKRYGSDLLARSCSLQSPLYSPGSLAPVRLWFHR
jgi:hypothetical protein